MLHRTEVGKSSKQGRHLSGLQVTTNADLRKEHSLLCRS